MHQLGARDHVHQRLLDIPPADQLVPRREPHVHDPPLPDRQDIAEEVHERLVVAFARLDIVRDHGVFDPRDVFLVVDLRAELLREHSPTLDVLALLLDAEAGVLDREPRVVDRIDHHIPGHVLPLVDGRAQAPLDAAAEAILALERELVVHVHLAPGEFVDPHERPARLEAIQPRPLARGLLVHRQRRDLRDFLCEASQDRSVFFGYRHGSLLDSNNLSSQAILYFKPAPSEPLLERVSQALGAPVAGGFDVLDDPLPQLLS